MLEHPHIVPLYDYWRDPDGAYLVTRWLRGGSLREALDRGPWNPEPAARLLSQVGAALSYAHRRGVVHRDLKPANVLLDEDGNGYLADFGIASRLTEDNERTPVSSSPAYLAPEELRGEPLSPRSDIYSLGLLTFELLSGTRPPMDGDLPAVSSLRPGIPAAVDGVIARARADDPADRFDTAEQFLEALSVALGRPTEDDAGGGAADRGPQPLQGPAGLPGVRRRRLLRPGRCGRGAVGGGLLASAGGGGGTVGDRQVVGGPGRAGPGAAGRCARGELAGHRSLPGELPLRRAGRRPVAGGGAAPPQPARRSRRR